MLIIHTACLWCTSMQHVHASCLCCMSAPHAYAVAACPRCNSMLHVCAACPCPCCTSCLILSFLPWQFCSAGPLLSVSFACHVCLSCLPVLFCLSCSACPFLPVLFCLFCSASPLLLVLFCLPVYLLKSIKKGRDKRPIGLICPEKTHKYTYVHVCTVC
jgi:hypothetical protein